MKHSHILIIGRIHDGDEPYIAHYRDMTESQARTQFTNEVRRDSDVPEADVVAGYEYTNVYIEYLATSDSPIELHIGD